MRVVCVRREVAHRRLGLDPQEVLVVVDLEDRFGRSIVTRQTTIDAISIGLPSWSFTFSLELSKLRTRWLTCRRGNAKGLIHHSPASRIVPL